MFTVNIYIMSNLKGFRRQRGIYGVVIEYLRKTGEPETREVFGEEDATDNQITLIALSKGLERLNKKCICKIYTDNDYVKNNIEKKTYESWRKNNWKNGKNKDVANKSEWQQLLILLDKHEVIFSCQENIYRSWLLNEIDKRAKVNERQNKEE